MLLLKYLPLAAGLVTALPHATPKKKSLSLPFDRRVVKSSNEWQNRRLRKRQDNGTTTGDDDATPLLNNNNIRYLASATLGGQSMAMILDTGSSDAFVYSVQPANLNNEPAGSQPPLFDNATAQGVTYLDLLYNASYGAGSDITTTLGAIGLTPLALNGTDIVADNLTFANVYDADSGLGGQGLIGLSFPLNSAIFQAVITAHNDTGTPLTPEEAQSYYPIVPLLHLQGKIDQPLFSLVVDRIPADLVAPADSDVYNYTYGSGALTLGDYPEGYSESDFTWSPVPVVQLSDSFNAAGYPTAAGFQWSTPLDAIYFNGKKIRNTTEPPHADDEGGNYYALVDSGNPAMQIPEDMMREITDAWAANPHNRVMSCDAEFELILQIGGQNFTMAKADMLVPSYQANDGVGSGGSATKDCQFQAQPAAPTGDEFGPNTGQTYALGDVFLRNVAAVFDYGNLLDSNQKAPRMGFAQR